MVTRYHRAIEDAVVQFGQGCPDVKKAKRGSEVALPIVDSDSKKVINYKPDAYFICKNRYKIIIQVLESELKKQDTIIADVTRACLVENCRGIIFIHPSSKKEDEDRVMEALLTVVRGLSRKGMPIDELPQRNNCYYITRSEAHDRPRLVQKLARIAREDGWFK